MEGFGEALIVDDLALAEEFKGIADVGIVDQAKEVIIGHARLLLGGEVLVEIGDHIALDADILGIKGNARGGLGIDACGMVDKIGLKSRSADLLLGEVTGQLMDDRGDHLEVGELVRTPMMEINTPQQKSLMYQEI